MRIDSHEVPLRRTAITIGAVLLLVAMERFSNYAFRSVFMLHLLKGVGMTNIAAGEVYGHLGLLTQLSPLLAGLLALLVRPHAVAMLGAAAASAGFFTLAGGFNLDLAVGLAGVGLGLFRTCPWVFLAEEIPRLEKSWPNADGSPDERRFALTAGAFLLAYAAVNAGAFVGPMAGGTVASYAGRPATFAFAGAGMVGVFALTLALAVFLRPKPADLSEGAITAPAPRWGAVLLGIVVVFVACVPRYVAGAVEGPRPVSVSTGLLSLAFVSGIASMLAALVAAAFLGSAAAGGRRVRVAWMLGLALVVEGVGRGFLALEASAAGGPGLLVGTGLVAAADPLVASACTAYVALATASRARLLVLATWSASTTAFSGGLGYLTQDMAPGPAELGLLAAIVVVAGALVVAFGRRLHALFEPVVLAKSA